ncbi:MAG TPA: molecular chaperone TorD family protein [Symbiobacteriaceae bacterium]|jgi:DMSO reductase family type II enzyme chaperone|nr:molecular chaperone TorD family protein [Symbiobacteriaceae bacterium]
MKLRQAVALALGRARVYAALSRGFLYPTPALAAELQQLPPTLCQALQEVSGAEGLAPFAEALRVSADLEQEYQALFGGQVPACPPYETEYTASHVWMQTQQMADIAGFYRAFGVDGQATGERVDYLTTELEFMYMLCVKEGIAEEEGRAEAVWVCRDAQGKFLQEHLAAWLPRFLVRLEQAGAEGYYPALVGLTERFVNMETRRVRGGNG